MMADGADVCKFLPLLTMQATAFFHLDGTIIFLDLKFQWTELNQINELISNN